MTDTEKQYVLLENYLKKKAERLGWKAVFFAVLQFQRRYYMDHGYRFTWQVLKKLGYNDKP